MLRRCHFRQFTTIKRRIQLRNPVRLFCGSSVILTSSQQQ
ncbi:hypothetical protein EVA_16065 [gut metagenome]|uniref:Uncharacterized protein n=1 Tax=gut metagenome TaxID=749906 RepID=J9FMZ7_9ZZZZ